ncbi:MAG: methyltransferase domain-containing protein [Actinobacteria bacterium]|nr:methyltransferase domain-containing protein [Actinomycetota bacterium]
MGVHDRIRDFWDRDAATYDRSPAHALSDPVEAAAWRAVLRRHLPGEGLAVLDAGAGTGAVSLLLAELGHQVTALDLSPAMLDRARAKGRGFEMEFRVGRADEPPPGPFDAVVERNMLWTNPDPRATLAAWRAVVRDGGRLLLLEGLHRRDAPGRARDLAAGAVRRALGVPPDHHGSYDREVLERLPLAGASSPGPLLEAVRAAGWRRVTIERLRDVEWARRLAAHPVLGPLESVPLFALGAEA